MEASEHIRLAGLHLTTALLRQPASLFATLDTRVVDRFSHTDSMPLEA